MAEHDEKSGWVEKPKVEAKSKYTAPVVEKKTAAQIRKEEKEVSLAALYTERDWTIKNYDCVECKFSTTSFDKIRAHVVKHI